MWVAVMWISKAAVNNHSHLRRCITIVSLDEPLFMEAVSDGKDVDAAVADMFITAI